MARKVDTVSVNTISVGETQDATAEVVAVSEVKEEAVPEVVINVTPEVKSYKVKPNKTFRKYVGDKWYFFKENEVISVPSNVRDLLIAQGALSVIS